MLTFDVDSGTADGVDGGSIVILWKMFTVVAYGRNKPITLFILVGVPYRKRDKDFLILTSDS